MMEVCHFRFPFAENKTKLPFSISSVSPITEFRKCGDMKIEKWRHKHGDIEKRRHGDMEAWRYGDMETWRNGDIETWTWRHGDIKWKSANGSPVDFP
jgi:hypothetical protein